MDISAIWLRNIGNKVQVLIETPDEKGEFKIVIDEYDSRDGECTFSHIVEESGLAKARFQGDSHNAE